MSISELKQKGSLYIVSAPSGAGKTSLVKRVLELTQGIVVSVSHTTRDKRPGENNGVEYHFVDKAAFEALISQKAFLEHAQVFDHYYGTAVSSVNNSLVAGKDVILEIDWQGADQVRTQFPEALSIFILPPSLTALRERLSSRGQDNDDIIDRRMRDAEKEISHYQAFDYLVINDNFDQAVEDFKAIVGCQRQLLARQAYQQEQLLRELLPSIDGI